MTPATSSALGAHVPVLADAAVSALVQDPDGIYVDATFGRGGHAARILQRLSARGRLIALDRDPAAAAAAAQWGDARLHFFRTPFSCLAAVLAAQGVTQIQGLLADLGVSSPQLEDPARGFSWRHDGPLDMRMDPHQGSSAAQWLAQASQDQIRRVLRDYGEERFAAPIAAAIVARRAAGRPLLRTADLAALVAATVPGKNRKDALQHPATRSFQALRIFLNQELAEVEVMLAAALVALAPAGRLAIISFHSLEDRIVKRFIDAHAHPARAYGRLPLREAQLPRPRLLPLGRIAPEAAEAAANPRARSAHLRVAAKPAAPTR